MPEYPPELIYLARLKVLIEKTQAWQRGDLDIVDAPKLTERHRRRLEERVLRELWRDMIQEAERLKKNTP